MDIHGRLMMFVIDMMSNGARVNLGLQPILHTACPTQPAISSAVLKGKVRIETEQTLYLMESC